TSFADRTCRRSNTTRSWRAPPGSHIASSSPTGAVSLRGVRKHGVERLQRSAAQAAGALWSPAVRGKAALGVFEGLLQGHGHASEPLSDPVGGERQVGFSWLGLGIAMGALEVRVDLHESAFVQRLPLGLPRGPRRNAFCSGDEGVGQGFIAVNVEEKIDTGLLHALTGVENLGAALLGRGRPFAVEIGPDRVAAQMTEKGTIRIHVGNDEEADFGAQLETDRIIGIEEPVEEAFYEPFGHALARMLPRDDPRDLAPCGGAA